MKVITHENVTGHESAGSLDMEPAHRMAFGKRLMDGLRIGKRSILWGSTYHDYTSVTVGLPFPTANDYDAFRVACVLLAQGRGWWAVDTYYSTERNTLSAIFYRRRMITTGNMPLVAASCVREG